jgi:hypothetical protein
MRRHGQHTNTALLKRGLGLLVFIPLFACPPPLFLIIFTRELLPLLGDSHASRSLYNPLRFFMSSRTRFGDRLRQFSQDGPQKDQRESRFGPAMFMKLPLISLYLRACIFECPTALDLSFCTFPDIGLFLLAGLFDYCIISLVCFFAEFFSTSPSTLRVVEITILMSSMILRLYIVGWRTVLICLKRINSKNIRPYGSISLLIKACPAAFWTIAISWSGFNTVRLRNWILSIAMMYLHGLWDYIDASAMLPKPNSKVGITEKGTPVTKSWTSTIFGALKASVVGIIVQSFAKYTPAFILFTVFLSQSIQTEFHAQPKFRSWGLEPIINFLDSMLPLHPLESVLVSIGQTIYALSSKLKIVPHILHALKHNSCQPPSLPIEILATSSSNSRRIRLLTIHSGSSDCQVECSWDWFDLDSSNLRYIALSYVWGSPERCCDIYINGRLTKTTESAIDALKMLRSPWKSKVVWIDAICIDQDDAADKERQIPYMADIYRKAAHVVVWLGRAEDGYLAIGLASTLWFRATLAKEFGGATAIKDIHQDAWKALRAMLSSKWFQRVWIIQEAVVARDSFRGDSVTVRYGNGSIDLQTLSWFTRECLTDSEVAERLSSSDSANVVKNIQAIEEFRSVYRAEGPNLSLLYYLARIFRTGLEFNASDDRDRIYALQNLSYQGSSTEDWFSPRFHLQVNYRLTVAQVFADIAKDLLLHRRADQSLDLLTHGGLSTNKIPNLPSWVPDWTASPLSYPFPGLDGSRELISHPNLSSRLFEISNQRRYGDMMNATMLGGTLERLSDKAKEIPEALYCAGMRSHTSFPKFQFRVRSDKQILQIVGMQEGKIADIASPFSPIGTPLKADRDGQSTLNPVAYIPPDWRPFAAKYTASEIFARTLVGDLSQTWIDLSQESIPTRPAPTTIDAHVKEVENIAHLIIHGDESGTKYYLQDPTHGFAKLDRNIRNMCAGRVLGVTEDGQLGLFPAGTQKGDTVCVFLAGCVPFILRAISDVMVERETSHTLYQLVGPCYVHGVMYGEAIKKVPYLELETFYIQ